jgi:hypothetical protein
MIGTAHKLMTWVGQQEMFAAVYRSPSALVRCLRSCLWQFPDTLFWVIWMCGQHLTTQIFEHHAHLLLSIGHSMAKQLNLLQLSLLAP